MTGLPTDRLNRVDMPATVMIKTFICLIPFHGNSFNIVSKRLAIIGIDIEIIKTFPPKSTLLAIAVSPVSLQMLTVNSVKNAIPVIFIRSIRNSLFIAVLFDKVVSKSIIAPILSIIITKISTPATKETYSTNSGLYCFTITIIISEISPNSNNFNYIHCLFILSYSPNIVLTLVNSVLISFITRVRTITSPANVVIIA